MDLRGPQGLGNVFGPDELEQMPAGMQIKLQTYIDQFFGEYCKERAAAHRLTESEQKREELQSAVEDHNVKLANFEQNVNELRTQLDQVSAERDHLLETIRSNEHIATSFRQEKNSIIEERDSLLTLLERQNAELERLKEDLHTYRQQLRNAISAKCEAIARVDEIQSKEVALQTKEQRIESERLMLQNEIQLLNSDLNRNNSELQNIRRENSINTMQLENSLREKCDALQIVQAEHAQAVETIGQLNDKIAELTNNAYKQSMATEQYVAALKNELDAKNKLYEIFKSTESQQAMGQEELLRGIGELREMLKLSNEENEKLQAELSATKVQHDSELAERASTIEELRKEISEANKLLTQTRDRGLEEAIFKMSPSAAVASRVINPNFTITELYAKYVKALDDLELMNLDNSKLKLHVASILKEVEERAPEIEQQRMDFENLKEAYDQIIPERDALLEKKQWLEESLERANFDVKSVTKKNDLLERSAKDLGRQVCTLLDELNCLRAGVPHVSHHNRSGDDSSQPQNVQGVISEHLVTFDSIVQLQERNQKLLQLTRELAQTMDEQEKEYNMNMLKMDKERAQKAQERCALLEEQLAEKNNALNLINSKCERYQKSFFAAQKRLGRQPRSLDDSATDMDVSETATLDTSAKAAEHNNREEVSQLEQRIQSLERQLVEEKSKYAALKENYEYYTSEKRKNDALAQEQFDSMRKEVRELTSTNCKLLNSTDFQKEQIDLLHRNVEACKKQISALEDRNRSYEKTIIKHEQTMHLLKDETMAAHKKSSAAEAEAYNLRQENRNLKDTATRLQIEKESFHRDQHSQSLLLNNLEFIKSNLERSETEGRLRLEQRLDDAARELAAQRRHQQEEQEKFQETVNEFKRQAETAIKLKEEERQQAEKWQAELVSVREELAQKVTQVNELSKKLQESLTPSMNENPVSAANKRAREFELKYNQAAVEIESLQKELISLRAHGEQFYKMSQTAEAEVKRLHELHSEMVANHEDEMKKLKSAETELRARIDELEAEAMLLNVTEQTKSINQTDQVKVAQDEMKTVLEKLTESGRTIRTLRTENTTLAESLHEVEVKYANEMVQHSADIQDLTKLKTDNYKLRDELNQLKAGQESLQAAHDELVKANAEAQSLLEKEKEETDKRVADLNALNATLHDQIEALTTKLTALSQSGTNTSLLNESLALDADQSLNISGLAAEEIRSNEQLLKIIKFLRQEKDLCVAKMDIMKAENARLKSELTIMQKKLDEVTVCLNQERSKNQTEVISTFKYAEVLRKIETLDAITDSNRILREERNSLTQRLEELTSRIQSLEKELFPLQCSNKELTSKIEELNLENTSLRTEAVKWRQRANVLVEKSNRNPEEFKRIQTERENLAKQLTAERELSKKQTDEIGLLKSELPALMGKLQALDDARKKQMEETINLRQANSRQTQDIMELKNRLLQKEEELMKATDELDAKEKALQEKDTKELALRKVAKRYREGYISLQAQQGGADISADLEKVRSELDELGNQYRAAKEELEKVTSENDALKSRQTEPETDANAVRQEHKVKVDKLIQDLTVARTDLVNQEATLASNKTQYDENVARLEKELQESIAANKEVNLRLTRENESLHMRINQLTRQLGSQQSTKPSTSSVAEKGNISESSSPRTANVKPMSGSATVQQSATVTPWRGGETPLASIRPISVQNSRTAAILPTSQQPSAGSASTSSSSTSTTSASASGSSSAVANTALVPPQQQVHTTGSGALESMASSSPTSSHTDYMPSTSSAAVAVAAIPPMGATSAAESSQEAESVQHPQQNDSQLFAGGSQQQVVALVSPRVEGSSSTSTSTSTATSTPNPTANPSVQDASQQSQQPSTSGSSSSSSTVVSSHSRHTPSSSNVTTTQAGCSSIGIKRPRDVEGDSTNTEDGVPEKMKRLRAPMHSEELSATHIGDSGMDVDQMPTSSQRDQEDDIQVVDSDDEDDVLADADDGPVDGGEADQEGYEDSYEQDNDMDNDGADDENEMASDAQDNNEVDIEEQQLQVQEESQLLDNQAGAAVVAAAASASTQENNQSQAITSGSGESSNPAKLPQAETSPWKQAVASTSSAAAASRRLESSSVEIVSSPQVSNFSEQPARVETAEVDGTAAVAPDESAGPSGEGTAAALPQKPNEAAETNAADAASKLPSESDLGGAEDICEADEAFAEETLEPGQGEDSQQLGNENQNVGTSQSELSDNQPNQAEGGSGEANEGTDGVSSEGEKQAVGVEEEGREAEATSPSDNTRYRNLRSGLPPNNNNNNSNTNRGVRRTRGNPNTNQNRSRIVWQRSDGPNNPNMQGDQGSPTNRGYNNQRGGQRPRGTRPRRQPTNNFNNNPGRY
ncbi:nucleoprotein TPR isoform X3 [Drosophila guanche]|uniref:nucleoprotein TPR isoform X3 n=1 Tax=Drosophila guanche TaxID=7266 RepID=UPI0014721107|nr:nucleoprotein TPR isoform X3 [Drosophila guanche]